MRDSPMRLSKIRIQNYRLLIDAELDVDEKTIFSVNASFKFGDFILSEGFYFDECADKKEKAKNSFY